MSESHDMQAVLDELRGLRERTIGITDSVVAASDGMLVAFDSTGIHPESIAALGSVALGLAKRTAETAALGSLHEVVTRCQNGYMVVFPIGQTALLIVLGDEGLNTAALPAQSRHCVEQLAKLLGIPPR